MLLYGSTQQNKFILKLIGTDIIARPSTHRTDRVCHMQVPPWFVQCATMPDTPREENHHDLFLFESGSRKVRVPHEPKSSHQPLAWKYTAGSGVKENQSHGSCKYEYVKWPIVRQVIEDKPPPLVEMREPLKGAKEQTCYLYENGHFVCVKASFGLKGLFLALKGLFWPYLRVLVGGAQSWGQTAVSSHLCQGALAPHPSVDVFGIFVDSTKNGVSRIRPGTVVAKNSSAGVRISGGTRRHNADKGTARASEKVRCTRTYSYIGNKAKAL